MPLAPIRAGDTFPRGVPSTDRLEYDSYHARLHPPEARSRPPDLIEARSAVSGNFSAPMGLRQFRFDRQSLPVRIGSFDDISVVRFSAKPELAILEPAAFVTDGKVLGARSRVNTRTYVADQDESSRIEYRVNVARRRTFYAWRLMLPLTLLTLVSWAVFWFKPVGLQPQISTCTAALIALVAFHFAIDFSLPKVAHPTLIDEWK